MPFFSVDTVTSTVAARLALKTCAAFVPVRIERLPNVRFRITLYEPITPDPTLTDSREAARDMTLSANRHFEDWIRGRPEQWLCTGKRWPSEMPARFARARS
ncbi:MAG: lysophospholipid acyltransferase family protein, partial [Geminicoccaceae bacterium]